MSTAGDGVAIDEFAREAREFLDRNATPRPRPGEPSWGEGSGAVEPERDAAADDAWLRAAREWKAIEFDAGFGWLTGPTRYGGRELPASHERAYRELLAGYDVPDLSPFTISLGMVAPTILAHGTELTRELYLRHLHRGELIGCQLFSEPGAGSDLASARTTAELDGDEWVVNGQKVWTSRAQSSDVGELLCRTDATAAKHRGLSALLVDMHAPGVTVRPLKQMNGSSSFNEVFLDAVRVPASHLLGEVNDGWRVAITTLMGERALGAGAGVYGIERAVAHLLLLARHSGAADDPRLRQLLADAVIRAKLIEVGGRRADARRRKGLPPGPAESVFKLANTELLREVADAAGRILGPRLLADTCEWGTQAWARLVLSVPGLRIAAGTDEVMRNILAERVLGLPKEPAASARPSGAG